MLTRAQEKSRLRAGLGEHVQEVKAGGRTLRAATSLPRRGTVSCAGTDQPSGAPSVEGSRMTAPAHSRYGPQLRILAGDAELLQIASTRNYCSPERICRRIYARFKPDSEPYATAVFEGEGSPQYIFSADLFTVRPVWAEDSGDWVKHPELGHIRFAPFTLDRSLKTLPSVMAAHPHARVLRYRPLRRCTIRVHEGDLVHVAKIFPDSYEHTNRGRQLVEDEEALWRLTRQADMGFDTARPEQWDAETRTLWQEYVEGSSIWPSLSVQSGCELAFQIGRAAASLTRSTLRLAGTFDAAAQMAASIRHAEELLQSVPEAASQLQQCLETLQAIHDDQTESGHGLRPIHGAMAPGQWLIAGSKLYLLDFDDLAFGDPELDVATFLHGLEIGLRSRCVCEEIVNAFLRGYEITAGRLNGRLMGAYLCHKRLYRALRRARSLRPDGDALALQVLQQAYESLVSAEVAC